MSIQKKSLLSSLNATKKAIVATSTTEANPSVNAPISARLIARKSARLVARKTAKITARASARKVARLRGV